MTSLLAAFAVCLLPVCLVAALETGLDDEEVDKSLSLSEPNELGGLGGRMAFFFVFWLDAFVVKRFSVGLELVVAETRTGAAG